MKRTDKRMEAPKIAVSDQTEVEQALINSELRYQRLFDSALEGIMILNAETGMISNVNPYLIGLLGYSREEFVEKSFWEPGLFENIEAGRTLTRML